MKHKSCNKKESADISLHATRSALHDRRGFIKLILLIVIGLIALGYFGLNIKDILASPVVKENLAYAWDLAKTLWSNYLAAPARWLWEHVVRLLWDLFINGLSGLKNGGGAETLMQ